jgi:hypothetical protein
MNRIIYIIGLIVVVLFIADTSVFDRFPVRSCRSVEITDGSFIVGAGEASFRLLLSPGEVANLA